MLRNLILLPLLAVSLGAEPGPPPDGTAAAAADGASEQPNVRDLGNGQFAVGLVNFDKKDREIRFPATINMVEGLLEYAIVHENGKIHESLLHTKTNPLHVNIAFKLLRYKSSPELFQILDEDYRATGKYPEVSEATKAAARVEVLLEWKQEDGAPGKAALNDWITNTSTESPIPASPWVYGGSYIYDGVFQAESTGDIAAIFTTNSALLNYPGQGHLNDEIWIPTPKRVPPVGTPVTVVIKPASAGNH